MVICQTCPQSRAGCLLDVSVQIETRPSGAEFSSDCLRHTNKAVQGCVTVKFRACMSGESSYSLSSCWRPLKRCYIETIQGDIDPTSGSYSPASSCAGPSTYQQYQRQLKELIFAVPPKHLGSPRERAISEESSNLLSQRCPPDGVNPPPYGDQTDHPSDFHTLGCIVRVGQIADIHLPQRSSNTLSI